MFHYVEQVDGHIDLTGSDDESVVQAVPVAQPVEAVAPAIRRRISGDIPGTPVPKQQARWTSRGGRGGRGR